MTSTMGGNPSPAQLKATKIAALQIKAKQIEKDLLDIGISPEELEEMLYE